jgi:hypothetical protein
VKILKLGIYILNVVIVVTIPLIADADVLVSMADTVVNVSMREP